MCSAEVQILAAEKVFLLLVGRELALPNAWDCK